MIRLTVTATRTVDMTGLLTEHAGRHMRAKATTFAELLRNELSAGTRTGEHYAHLPRRSSARGEPEQEQSGALRDSVDARPLDAIAYGAGFYDEDAGKLQALEINPANPRYRGTLTRLAESATTRRLLDEATP